MYSPQQQSVGPREILLAVVLVVAGVILMGALMGSPTAQPARAPQAVPAGSQADGPPRELDDPAKASAHADELARRSGGDLNRLSEQDQRWLDASTAGHAREFLAARRKALEKPFKPAHDAKEKPAPKTP
jgi:hypothetical protein